MMKRKPRPRPRLRVGLFASIALIAIALKLAGFIDLEWLWVLSPLWAVDIVVVILALFILTIDKLLIRGKDVE